MSLLISVVSHGQAPLVHRLLRDMDEQCRGYPFEVLLTLNRPEDLPFSADAFQFPLQIVANRRPKGFGANHNAAFHRRPADFFAVMNPDLRLRGDPFPTLMAHFENRQVGLVAPLVLNEKNEMEDSARLLPTPWRIVRRVLRGKRGRRSDYPAVGAPIHPDWVAGMFMLFPGAVFARLGGFDEGYFLYFEDVDVCTRLQLLGYRILLDPRVSVVHNARRESHKKWPFLAWHIRSGIRFFRSPVYREMRRRRSPEKAFYQ